jgi:hypothetical protein
MRFSIAARSSGVFRRERALVGKVVVEAVLDHRADRHLRFGKQLFHRVGQQVRRRVAQDLQAIGILVGDDGQLGVGFQAMAQVHHLGLGARADAAGERRFGQTGADRGGHVGHGRGLRKLAARTIGQRDRDHDLSSCGTQRLRCGEGSYRVAM